MLDSIDYEEDKDQEEFDDFYKLLAHSPYRKLMIMEGFCYKALLQSKQIGMLGEDSGKKYSIMHRYSSTKSIFVTSCYN